MIYALIGGATIMVASVRSRRDKLYDFCVAFGLVIFCLAPLAPAALLSRLEGPRNFDWLLYRADLALNLDSPTFAVYCYATPWVRQALTAIYSSLPLALALAWLLSGRPQAMVRVVLWSGIAAFAVFTIIPAAGPSHVFQGYPFLNPALSRYSLPAMVPRNAFPSLHLSWALLALGNARGRCIRAALFVFAILTGFATVGGGEHYFVDLIAAVPFCAVIQLLTEGRTPWTKCFNSSLDP